MLFNLIDKKQWDFVVQMVTPLRDNSTMLPGI